MAVIKITYDNFDKEVLQSPVPVLVDFWASWCGPCKMLSPIIEELGETADGYKVASVNADEEMDLMLKYDVQAIPTLIVFKDGEVAKRNTGFIPKAAVLDLLK